METLIRQGAEGRLYLGEYKGEKCLIKERFIKKYRHPDLDTQITRQRMKAETKAICRCQNAGILVPKIYHTDFVGRKIYMEYCENTITAKQYINQLIENRKEREKNDTDNDKQASLSDEDELKLLCEHLGEIIGKMHTHNIIHGDLTTSNVLINNKSDKGVLANNNNYDIILIDFGLSSYSESIEDKSVDLYVLERAITSTHSDQPQLIDYILKAYRQTCPAKESVLNKLEEVRLRGRKRTMIG